MRTLERLLELPEAPRVVVVDNRSDDPTVDAVRTVFPEVDLVALPANEGAHARTVGAAMLDAPYVAFADDDSWWARGSLSRAADAFDACPPLGLLAGRVLVGDTMELDPVSRAQEAGGLPPVPGIPGRPILGFLACGAIVRRTAYLDTGGFDRLLHFLGEETPLALDLAARGWAMSYLPELVAYHHPGDRPAADTGFRVRRALRNQILTAWTRRPAFSAGRVTVDVMMTSLTDRDSRAAVLEALRRLRPAVTRRRPISRQLDGLLDRLSRPADPRSTAFGHEPLLYEPAS